MKPTILSLVGGSFFLAAGLGFCAQKRVVTSPGPVPVVTEPEPRPQPPVVAERARPVVVPLPPVQVPTPLSLIQKYIRVVPASNAQPTALVLLGDLPATMLMCASVDDGGLLSCRTVAETRAWLLTKR